MGSVVAMQSGALTRRDGRRLDLFRRTVGKELVGPEIDEALEWCELYGANPFVRDIYFFPFGKVGTDKRRVVPVLGIGLYRKIAARSGNYRPDHEPPRFHYDPTLAGVTNPTGMAWCEVGVWQYSHGDWHRIVSRLKWDERAPIKEIWENGTPTGRFQLDPGKQNWRTMPETMMAKCAEADAIRKAWPLETAGSYVSEEMDAPQTIEATAVEIAESYASEQRLRAVGAANAILIDWMDGKPLVHVPVGQLGDAAIAWVRANAAEPMTVKLWAERNQHALREYWGRDKAGALALKAEVENATQG